MELLLTGSWVAFYVCRVWEMILNESASFTQEYVSFCAGVLLPINHCLSRLPTAPLGRGQPRLSVTPSLSLSLCANCQ